MNHDIKHPSAKLWSNNVKFYYILHRVGSSSSKIYELALFSLLLEPKPIWFVLSNSMVVQWPCCCCKYIRLNGPISFMDDGGFFWQNEPHDYKGEDINFARLQILAKMTYIWLCCGSIPPCTQDSNQLKISALQYAQVVRATFKCAITQPFLGLHRTIRQPY